MEAFWDYFFKKYTKIPVEVSSIDDSRDEFFRMIEEQEEALKQRGRRSKKRRKQQRQICTSLGGLHHLRTRFFKSLNSYSFLIHLFSLCNIHLMNKMRVLCLNDSILKSYDALYVLILPMLYLIRLTFHLTVTIYIIYVFNFYICICFTSSKSG